MMVQIRKAFKMDAQEHTILFDFVKEQRVMNSEQRTFNKTIMDEVRTIKRGMYGDSENGVKGLIQRQEEDEKQIKELKGFRNKMIWAGSGLVLGVQGIWEFIKWKSK